MNAQVYVTVAAVLAAPALLMSPSTPAVAAVEENSSVCVDVPDAMEGDVAVVNITPARSDGTGYGALRAFGADPIFERQPDDRYSSVNVAADTPPNPNLALVTAGPGGRVCYDAGVASHDVLLDVAALIPAANIDAIDPTRLIDTRDGSTPVGPGTSLCLAVPDASPGDVAVVNITPTRAVGTGFGSLRARGATPIYDRVTAEQYSSVNFASGQPVNPNLSFVTIGTESEICYDAGGAFHDVILDLAAVLPASAVIAAEPRRLYDSRSAGRDPVEPGVTVCLPVPEAEPGDVVVVNITPTRARGTGFGAMSAAGETPVTERPVAEQYSSVNFAANTPPNPNLAVVEVGASGSICYNGAIAAHDVILDVATVIKGDAITTITPRRLLDTRNPVGAIPLRIEIEFAGDHPVRAAYPARPLTSIGEITNGYTKVPVSDNTDSTVTIGEAVGYIVDNGDGTISGAGYIEERSGELRAAGSVDGETVWSYVYPGFGLTCPEQGDLAEAPGLYVLETRIPVVFSGTVQTFGFGQVAYQISIAAGIGATPGVPGAVPELDVLVDTMGQCEADFAACSSNCGSTNFPTYADVDAERDEYVLNHLRINEAIVESSVIDVFGPVFAEESTNFQTRDVDDVRVRLQVRLG